MVVVFGKSFETKHVTKHITNLKLECQLVHQFFAMDDETAEIELVRSHHQNFGSFPNN